MKGTLTEMANLLPEILDLLVCPVPECRQHLRLEADMLNCSGCGRRYRIEENWPVLIPEEGLPPVARMESGPPPN